MDRARARGGRGAAVTRGNEGSPGLWARTGRRDASPGRPPRLLFLVTARVPEQKTEETTFRIFRHESKLYYTLPLSLLTARKRSRKISPFCCFLFFYPFRGKNKSTAHIS